MFIQRQYGFTEHDDFVRHVSSRIGSRDGATPVVSEGVIVGWIIKPIYE